MIYFKKKKKEKNCLDEWPEAVVELLILKRIKDSFTPVGRQQFDEEIEASGALASASVFVLLF